MHIVQRSESWEGFQSDVNRRAFNDIKKEVSHWLNAAHVGLDMEVSCEIGNTSTRCNLQEQLKRRMAVPSILVSPEDPLYSKREIGYPFPT